MAWTAPMTYTSGNTLTAAQQNVYVRDNINETAPGKASAASRWFVSNGANDMREREVAGNTVTPSENTTSSSYTNLSTFGADVTVFTGTTALVWIQCLIQHNTAGAIGYASYEVASGTTVAASDTWCIRCGFSGVNDDQRAGVASYRNGLNNASNIFRMQYKTNTGTASFAARHILVMGM